ncbi:MAG: hypothetical protein CW346_16945 [Bacillaceae bacterium]|nr:hypothetical protein [Bacillaceae bacterium]
MGYIPPVAHHATDLYVSRSVNGEARYKISPLPAAARIKKTASKGQNGSLQRSLFRQNGKGNAIDRYI